MACGEESAELSTGPAPEPASQAPHTEAQALSSTNKVLILGSSVSGGLQSREAQAVRAVSPTTQLEVVTAEQWRAMTAQQFMTYRALIIGDAACQSGTAAFQAAVDNRNSWGPIVDGDVALLSTDPANNGTPQLVENAIRFALNSVQNRTGMYIALGCAYQGAPAHTPVPLLEPFGTFKVQGVPGCADSGHIFEMYNSIMSQELWDGLLAGNGCAARSVFTQYPERNFSYVALAQSSEGHPIPGEQFFTDFTMDPGNEVPFIGTPYVLVRGASPLGAGCGLLDYAPSGEECDMGDGMNGQAAAIAGGSPLDTCSYSCRSNWCGDGVVDTLFGEECDNGIYNGRAGNAGGTFGSCSSSCKLLNLPPANNPPVALCQNVTVVAEYTCGVDASIDRGSYDPDNDLLDCTQSPAGPYNVGNTTVTLTCRDRAYHTASCTGVVTVVDRIAPVVTLNGPANLLLECNRNALYSDAGATAHDLCEGTLPTTRTGAVNMGQPNTYTMTYTSTDSANNRGTATRTVTVSDSLAPSLTLSGSATLTMECGGAFNDPGASSSDQCAGNLTGAIVKTGTLNTSTPGAYTLRYNVKDPSNNAAAEKTRTVSVVDTLRPTVSVIGPLSQALECGDTYEDPGATGLDQCAGPLPVTTSGAVNPSVPGTYTLGYSARDPSGNVGTAPAQRTVTVSDTLPPTLTLNGSTSMALECGSPYSEPGASARDQCAGTVPVTVSGSVNNWMPGVYALGYSTNDGLGHSVSATRTVTVSDTLAPQIQPRPGPSTLQCNGTPYEDPGATANDACAGDLTPAITTTSNLDQTRSGQYTVTYRVEDASGNVGTAVRALTVGPCTACSNIRLGDYNLFLLENYTGGHDVVGKVAAGGNITMTDFSVGWGLPASNISNTLVAGGNLTLSRGAIWGDAFYGGSLSADPSVTQVRGTRAQGTPIDFAARFSELRGLSSQLAGMTATGTTRRESWGGISMNGTSSNVNVFDISASAFTGAVYWQINAPAGSLVVVNIRGASASFSNFGIQFGGGINQHGVLFNFVDTTLISAQGFGIWGTVLAPYADVQFNNGSWDGGIYAKSFTGNAEGHINPLNDRDICP
jgi:choice-of-anchor A domain-containing protein